METTNFGRWLFTAVALTLSASVPRKPVRISEIHYDNAGTDTGEAIEVSAPAGTDLTGWSRALQRHRRRCRTTPTSLLGRRARDLRRARRDGDQLPVQRHPERLSRWHRAGRQQRRTGRIPLVRRDVSRPPRGAATGITSTDIGGLQTSGTPIGESLQRNADRTSGLAGGHASAPATTMARRRPIPKSRASRSRREDRDDRRAAARHADRDGVRRRERADHRRATFTLDQQPTRGRDGERDRRRDRRVAGRARYPRHCRQRRGRFRGGAGQRCTAAARRSTSASTKSTTTTSARMRARPSRSKVPPARTSRVYASCSTTAATACPTTRADAERHRCRRAAVRAA